MQRKVLLRTRAWWVRNKVVAEDGCDFFVAIKEGYAICPSQIGIRGRRAEIDNCLLFGVCFVFALLPNVAEATQFARSKLVVEESGLIFCFF